MLHKIDMLQSQFSDQVRYQAPTHEIRVRFSDTAKFFFKFSVANHNRFPGADKDKNGSC